MTEAGRGDTPLLSVVVPTRGDPRRLLPFLDALDRQTLARQRFELIAVFDGVPPTDAIAARLAASGARTLVLERPSGPPVARNRGARAARGTFLVSTDDDVVPDPDWLERAAQRLDADPTLDVLEGVTRKPGGRAVRMHAEERGQYILCNLVARRSLFERVGGFDERYFDPASGVFFREDADLGWLLEEAGARVSHAPDVVVVHPDELPGFLDPLRWTRRYVMDGLLAARFPRRFRERIEVHRLGPISVRRPIVRASAGYVILLGATLVAAAAGQPGLAAAFLMAAAACLVAVWAKWRFDPRRLPIVPLVPFALVSALLAGKWRARGVKAEERH